MNMKTIGILLLVVGAIGLVLSTMMFGDIGIAVAMGAITAILTSIGFLKLNKQLGLYMKEARWIKEKAWSSNWAGGRFLYS